jgi:hypothetical protein
MCAGCYGCAALVAPRQDSNVDERGDPNVQLAREAAARRAAEAREQDTRDAAARRTEEARETAAREAARKIEKRNQEIVRAVRRAELIAKQEAEERIPSIVLPIEQATKRLLDRESYRQKRLTELKAGIAMRFEVTINELEEIVNRYSR